MKRLHLFEFEDFSWFPKIWRDAGTDFLRFLANKMDMWKGAIPVIEKGLEKSGGQKILDLCSGGGGGMLKLQQHLKEKYPDLEVRLSDLYPNKEAFEWMKQESGGEIDYIDHSVDATNVPPELGGFRTQFLSFHHFRPEMARKILKNAADCRVPIGIFEAQQRNLKSIIPMMLSGFTVLFTTPFIRPFKISRLFFTYVIPVIPMYVPWDGVVSALRTYSEKELKALTDSIETEDYTWEIGKVKSGPGEIIYLLGYPEERSS